MPTKVCINTHNIQAGDEFITPAFGEHYRVISIDKYFVLNEIRHRLERVATCVWLEDNTQFISYFPDTGIWTIRGE